MKAKRKNPNEPLDDQALKSCMEFYGSGRWEVLFNVSYYSADEFIAAGNDYVDEDDRDNFARDVRISTTGL